MITLTAAARCFEEGCDWAHEGPGSDRAAAKHTEKDGHPTVSGAQPDPKETP